MTEKQSYFDIVLGTPFFTWHRVELDFKNHHIVIDGKAIPVYNVVYEVEVICIDEQEWHKGLAKQLCLVLIVNQAGGPAILLDFYLKISQACSEPTISM